jgi:hypothetical protein
MYDQQPHLGHQKSSDSAGYYAAPSIEAYDEYNRNYTDDLKQPMSNCVSQLQHQSNAANQPTTVQQPAAAVQLSKLTSYALHLPIPEGDAYQHERNQRFVILYGFGNKK